MITVAVSGGMGRLGNVIAKAVSNSSDMQLSGVYSPSHALMEMKKYKHENLVFPTSRRRNDGA